MEEARVEIRSAEPEDYAALQALHAQPRVIHGTMQLPFPSRANWRRQCGEPSPDMRFLVACVDGAVVGSIVLHFPAAVRRRHAAELGMAVHDAWQGRGVGSALLRAVTDLADKWLGLTRIELTVYTDNAPAIALYEKFGFVREGRMARYAFRNGAYVDVFAMARLLPPDAGAKGIAGATALPVPP